jgi:hypothetical protein
MADPLAESDGVAIRSRAFLASAEAEFTTRIEFPVDRGRNGCTETERSDWNRCYET